jgi:hypothetical protein
MHGIRCYSLNGCLNLSLFRVGHRLTTSNIVRISRLQLSQHLSQHTLNILLRVFQLLQPRLKDMLNSGNVLPHCLLEYHGFVTVMIRYEVTALPASSADAIGGCATVTRMERGRGGRMRNKGRVLVRRVSELGVG